MNILDLPDLEKGDWHSVYAYRLLNRTSTRQLRLVEWQQKDDGPRQVMEKVGPPLLRRWPLITRIQGDKSRSVQPTVETVGGGTLAMLLDPFDMITVEVA